MKNHTLTSLGILVVVLMALVLAAPASADEEGNILRVGPGPEYDYETIQAAVNDARQGSRILVYSRINEIPARYEESVTITTNNLQIIAQDSDVTVNPPIAWKPGFDVNADHVTIRGFDISGVECAPGIKFQGSHNTFAENIIHLFQCDLTSHAAIRCFDDDGGSDYNTIESNILSGWGHADMSYGVYVNAGTDALNEGNIIKNNTLEEMDGPGIYVNNGTGFEISGNLFENIFNHGCILVEARNNEPQGHHRILKNTMHHCGGENGGISLHAFPGTVLAHNRIVDNWLEYCDEDGLSLEADDGAALTHNQVMSNNFGMSYSNGIHLSAGQDAAVNDNLIIDNVVYGNMLDGISLTTGSDHNRILNNEVQTNHEFGVAVAGDNNLIVGNWIWNNAYFYADTGVGNRWRNNNYLNP
jgi:parallel beta-helix repeat protein